MPTASFHHSARPEPHRIRTLQILKQYPEVKRLMGKNPLTLFAIVGLVGGMIALSYFVKDSPWWVILLVAYGVGAFFNHALFVMIHECSHHLLFKRKAMNYLASILANLPHTVPTAKPSEIDTTVSWMVSQAPPTKAGHFSARKEKSKT